MMGLFTYLSILDVGIVIVAWFNAWRILNVIGFVGTFHPRQWLGNQYYTNEQLRTGTGIPDPVLPALHRGRPCFFARTHPARLQTQTE